MRKRIYHLNEDTFKDIDSQEKAYWLGFFSADGSITENKVRLTLSDKDYTHLQLWKTFIGWTGKDYFHVKEKAHEVYFRSSNMVADLARFTVTKRKTYTIRFPVKEIPPLLLRHYVRGYFDGDGCITKQTRRIVKPNKKEYSYDGGEFSIESNEEFLSLMQEHVFCSILSLPCTSIKYIDSINRLRYGGIDQLATIYHYLYDNSSTYLHRKKAIFKEILIHRDRLSERTP